MSDKLCYRKFLSWLFSIKKFVINIHARQNVGNSWHWIVFRWTFLNVTIGLFLKFWPSLSAKLGRMSEICPVPIPKTTWYHINDMSMICCYNYVIFPDIHYTSWRKQLFARFFFDFFPVLKCCWHQLSIITFSILKTHFQTHLEKF